MALPLLMLSDECWTQDVAAQLIGRHQGLWNGGTRDRSMAPCIAALQQRGPDKGRIVEDLEPVGGVEPVGRVGCATGISRRFPNLEAERCCIN